LIYNHRYSQYNTKQNRLCFSRHLRILRYKQLKEFSKLLMFVYDILRRVLALYACMLSRWLLFSKSSSLFIEELRDVENLAVTSTCLALKLWFFTLDLLPDLIVVLWRTYFKSIPKQKEQRLQQCYCYLCLVVETKIAEMVVAKFVVVHFVQCVLCQL